MFKKKSGKTTKKGSSPKGAAPASPEAKKETASQAAAMVAPTVGKLTGRESKKAQPTDPRLPAPGTAIQKRDRHGAIRCECKVEEGGIRYAGKVYSSLSGAAMVAAKDLGLKYRAANGFVFWGLVTPPRPVSDPVLALERAWERYRERAEAMVKEGVSEENRSNAAASLGRHAQLIERLRGSATLKGASAK